MGVPFLEDTASDACADIAVDGFRGCHTEWVFVDICVFNPFAYSYDKEKKRQHGKRIHKIEHVPLVFSLTGGMAKETTIFTKCWPT